MAANTSSRNRDVIKFPSPRPSGSQVVRVVPPWKWRQPGGIRQRFVSTVSRWVKCEWGGCSVRWFHLLIALRLARRWRDFFQCWRRPHLEGVMGLTWSGGVVARARARGLNLVPRLSPLVATGHVTTQNLGGKKISSAGEVTECLVFWCDKLYGFQNLDQRLKTTRSIGVWSRIDFRSPRKFGSRMDMEQKLFDG